MTVVIAAVSKDDKQAGIATDKMASNWLEHKLAAGKIIRKPDLLFGYAGSFEGAAAFKQWSPPRRFRDEDPSEFLERLQSALREHLKKEAVDLKEVHGILLYNARIFAVQSAEMFEVEDSFAIGSGLGTAIGAFEAAKKLSPNMSLQKQLELAVEIANKRTSGCGFGCEVVMQEKE